MKKIAFIIHAKAKQKQALIKDINLLFDLPDFETQVFETQHYQDAIILAQNAADKGFTHIIACGGDGTLNEVLNGILLSKNTGVKLGLIAKGSGNDFIKTIQSPATLVALRQAILQDSSLKIDIGKASFQSRENKPETRFFINITDVGLGGEIAQELFLSKKIFGPSLTYQYFIIKKLLTFKPKKVKITGDDFVYESKVMNFCAANARYFGSGLGIAPEANITDGMLNAVALGDLNLFDYFKHLPAIRACKSIVHPEVKYMKSKTLYFEAENYPMPIDMDGEFIGFLPMKIETIRAAIEFIC
jgi:diacylglycerol kinase (ATP)